MHLLKNFWTLGIVVLNLTGCGITDYPTVTLLSQVQTDSCWLTCAHMQIYTLKKKLKEREINWKLGWFKNSTVPLIKGIYLDQSFFVTQTRGKYGPQFTMTDFKNVKYVKNIYHRLQVDNKEIEIYLE